MPASVQIPPQALEAEKAVLGAMLLSKDAVEKALDIIEDRDFYQDSHRRIYFAARSLYERNEAVDVVTVGEELRRQKALDDVGGMELLTDLVNRVATAAHVEHYARLVRDKAILRELIATATNVVTACYQEAKEPSEILDEAQASVLKVAEKQVLRGVLDVKALAHEAIEQIEAAVKRRERVIGVPSGIANLDRVTAGFQKSDLILIAARPSQGKTALALNIAANAALNPKNPVPTLFFSMEMSGMALMQRLMASDARINLQDMRTGFLARDRWTALTSAAAKFSEAPLRIVDMPGLSVTTVRSIARQNAVDWRRQGKELGLIVIDYLQLMRGSSFRSESRQQEVSEISRGLKFLARDLNIPVIALSQLSRRPEDKGRSDGRPQLSDLRESGALEQDADLVAFIYRESYYKRDDPTIDETKAEIIVAKNRQGPTDAVPVRFFREYTRFENLIEGEPEAVGISEAV
ncbi:MAG: replicative DNA helicase [Elusimicrobia bacterium]|nr:replicative DNA helicase [Elusimicrobiota bacterium]MDE2314361.1 replicative DNA helicase [Elusimicrobiota bacterium]